YAPLSREALYDYVSNVISPQLSGIEGLYKIEVTGGTRSEYIVAYHLDQLQSHGLKPEALSAQIEGHYKVHKLGISMNLANTCESIGFLLKLMS
ncbi:MAG TPA: hypothetical protein PKD85_21315, partial [Saprospiraceae bacterium]|nr:hypothetical protein [Saprospiraceae bacterium]